MIHFIGSHNQKQEESLHQQAGHYDIVARSNRSQVILRVRFALLAGIQRFVGAEYAPVESAPEAFDSPPK